MGAAKEPRNAGHDAGSLRSGVRGPDNPRMEARHPQAMDAGLFLLAVAVPLAFFPLSSAPFADAKLVLLTLGTLLLWVSGVPVDRRLALPAGVWIAVVGAATVAGVDPGMSIIGAVNHGTGLITLAACASLVVLGPNIPPDAVSRMGRWLVGTGLVVAAVAVGFRVAPDAFDRVVRDLSFRGSTAGNPVFAAAFLAACIPAAVGSKATGRRLVAVLAVLALGFAANGERSSLLLPLLAPAACLWPMRADRARVFLAGATLVVVVSGWVLLVAPLLPSASHEVSETARQFDTLTGERQRLAVYTADLRGFTRRPVLGWGPTNTWSAFLSSATPEEIDTAGRGWAEAHNIVLESLVTTGLAGTAAFVWLVLRIAPRMARPSWGVRWAAGGALTLVVFHLYEPFSLTVTPLMFLLAGVSVRAPPATPGRGTSAGARRLDERRSGLRVRSRGRRRDPRGHAPRLLPGPGGIRPRAVGSHPLRRVVAPGFPPAPALAAVGHRAAGPEPGGGRIPGRRGWGRRGAVGHGRGRPAASLEPARSVVGSRRGAPPPEPAGRPGLGPAAPGAVPQRPRDDPHLPAHLTWHPSIPTPLNFTGGTCPWRASALDSAGRAAPAPECERTCTNRIPPPRPRA